MTLGKRLVLLVALAAVPVAAVQIYQAFSDREMQRQAIATEALRLAELEADRLGQIVQMARGVTGAAAQHPAVTGIDGPACDALARRLLAAFPEFVGFGAFTPDGNSFCRSSPGPSVHVGDRPYFREVLRERRFTASGYMIGRAVRQPTLAFVSPALRPDGSVQAVVLAAYPVERLGDVLSRLQLPEGASVNLVDAEGTVVARFPPLAREGEAVDPRAPAFLEAMDSEPRGTVVSRGADGIERVYGYAPLVEPARLRAVVGLPLAPALARIDERLYRNLGLLAGIFGLAAVAALLTGEFGIRRPIQDLRRVARALASGHLAARTRPARYPVSELAELANTFDEMARAISEREARIAASEAFSRRILESSMDCIKVLDLDGRLQSVNGYGVRALEAADEREVIGARYLDFWPDTDRDAAETAVGEARAGRAARFFGQTLARSGNETWWDVAVTPITGETGRVERILVISRDVTEAKRAEQQRELLMAELDHRVKNMLASVHSIAARTLGSGRRAGAFLARIHAIARTHGLLSRRRWEGASMRDLATATLDAFGERIRMHGPDLPLDHGQTQALGMVLHELATNAAKHGALSVPEGRVELQWRREANGDRALVLDWSERGGPAAARPERTGFGLTLLERTIENQLGGRADLAFTQGGFHCTLRLPLRGAEARRGDVGRDAAEAKPGGTAPLAGRRVLLVEDAVLIAMETEDILRQAGCVVIGPASNLPDGMRLAAAEALDAAVLDVDLAGEPVFPLAAALHRQGVRFVFVTGYNERSVFPSEFAHVPRIGKPFDRGGLLAALAAQIAPPPPADGSAAGAGRHR